MRCTVAALRNAYRHKAWAPEAPTDPKERWEPLGAADAAPPGGAARVAVNGNMHKASRVPVAAAAAATTPRILQTDAAMARVVEQRWKVLPAAAPYVRIERTLAHILEWLRELRAGGTAQPAGATYVAALKIVGGASAAAARDVMADYSKHALVVERRVVLEYLGVCKEHKAREGALAALRLLQQRDMKVLGGEYQLALSSIDGDDASVDAILGMMNDAGTLGFLGPDLLGDAIRACGTYHLARSLANRRKTSVKRYAIVALAQVAMRAHDPEALRDVEALRKKRRVKVKARYYNYLLTGYRNLGLWDDGLAVWDDAYAAAAGALAPDAFTLSLLVLLHTSLSARYNDKHFKAAHKRWADYQLIPDAELSTPCYTALMTLYAKHRPHAAVEASALLQQFTSKGDRRSAAVPAPLKHEYELSQGRESTTKLPKLRDLRTRRPSPLS